MRIGTKPVVRVVALAMLVVACAGSLALPVSAQEVVCADEPLLGTFDANGDGILMVEEVREAAPDDDRIQSVADQMEAAGVGGIQYRGCDQEGDSGNSGGDSGANDGDENSGSADDNSGSGNDTATSDQEQATDNASGATDTSTGDEPADADATAVATPEPDTGGETGWFDERLTVTTLPGVGDGPQQGSSGAGVVVLGTTLLLTLLATALWRTARRQARR